MKKYELVLFDIDGTLLDFEKAERIGMKETLSWFGLRNDDEIVDSYNEINMHYWKMFERGEISLDNLLVKRHEALFDKYGFSCNSEEFNHYYEGRLKYCGFLMDHALETLDYVKTTSCKTAVVTNGIYETQTSRLALSRLDEYFKHVYISEKVGYSKPQKEIFQYIFRDIGQGIEKENVLIVGDSLTSDIKGGNDFGIDTCWVNPKGLENHLNLRVDYEIQNLLQLKDIIV